MSPVTYTSGRRFGLDWLRIGAFALLILYHIGMYFVPWEWHVKSARPEAWVEIPMMAVNAWRLALLFLISGFASRILLGRARDRFGFLRERSLRLLVPLLFGMALVVAPQAWAELRTQHAYSGPFWSFWLNDYFEFGSSFGLILPTWNHLWFVAYLWVYTLILVAAACAPEPVRRVGQALFEKLFGGWRLFLFPVLWLISLRLWVLPSYPSTHALTDDFYNHGVFLFCFLFGAGLARSEASWILIVRRWWLSAAVAVAAFAFYLLVQPDDEVATVPVHVARSLQTWCMLMALAGAAQAFLHQDNAARRYLTEAIFPFYIAHQTIIVLAGLYLRPLGLSNGVQFILIASATVAGCILTYEIARRVPLLRLPLGLAPRRAHNSGVPRHSSTGALLDETHLRSSKRSA